MNKQIRALMDEAVTFRLDPDSNAYKAQVCPEDLEAFAELIVRECAEVAGCNGHVSGFALGDLVKKHFGVEA